MVRFDSGTDRLNLFISLGLNLFSRLQLRCELTELLEYLNRLQLEKLGNILWVRTVVVRDISPLIALMQVLIDIIVLARLEYLAISRLSHHIIPIRITSFSGRHTRLELSLYNRAITLLGFLPLGLLEFLHAEF